MKRKEQLVDFDRLPIVLVPREVAQVLKVGPNQVYDMLRAGQIPAIRTGRTWRIGREALRQFVNGGAGNPTAVTVVTPYQLGTAISDFRG